MSLLVFLMVIVAFFGTLLVMLALTGQRMAQKLKMTNAHHISDAGVRELVTQGQLDEAVELYRRFTGVDVFTAKRAIEDMETEMRLSGSEPEIRRLLRLGDKAGAIEMVQQATGGSLADALAAVEALELRKGG